MSNSNEGMSWGTTIIICMLGMILWTLADIYGEYKKRGIRKSVKLVEDNKFVVFRVLNIHGSDTGMISYLGSNEWRVYVDGIFPLRHWMISSVTLSVPVLNSLDVGVIRPL